MKSKNLVPLYLPSKNRIKSILKLEPWIFNYPGDWWVVIGEEDYEKYSEHIPKEHLLVHNLSGGLGSIRNFIYEHAENHFELGSWVLQMDDDLKQVEFYENGEWKVYKDTKSMVDLISKLVDLYGKDSYLIGANGVDNRFFKTLKPNTFGFVCGDFFFVKLTGKRVPEDKLQTKQDWFLLLRFLEEGKKIYSLGNLNVCAKHYGNKGGWTDYDRVSEDKKAQEYLLKRFPKFLRKKERKNSKYEISLVRSKASKNPSLKSFLK